MNRKILLVDDDDIFAKTVQTEFNNEDEVVIMASDGEEGLNKAKSELPSVIILDVIMPKMGGLDLLLMVRKAYPNTPVILITAFGDWQSLIQAYENGAINYICKPFKTMYCIQKAQNSLNIYNGCICEKRLVNFKYIARS